MIYCGYSKEITAVWNISETSLGWVPQKTPKDFGEFEVLYG